MAEQTQPTPPPPTPGRRRLRIGANVLTQILALAIILVMANWLVSRHYLRFDWTRASYYKLSEKTKQVLGALDQPLDIIVFIPPAAERDYVQKVLEDVRNLLKEFKYYGRDRLDLEYVDPQRDVARARLLVEQYNLDPLRPEVVIFASGERNKYVTLDELVELDFDPYGMGGGRVRAFKGEGVFLAAIQTVTEEDPPRVYFITGHGERDPDDFDRQHGYSELATALRRDNISVARWNLQEKLAGPEPLPGDADALIIAGPKRRYTEAAINTLQHHLENKGRLLVMLDPRYDTGLESWLRGWGVQVDDNLVIARAGMMLGAELLVVDPPGTDYAPHPITDGLHNINTAFPYARSVRRHDDPQLPAAHRPQVVELVRTPREFWGETDLESPRATFDPETDLRGPLSLAVAVEMGNPLGLDIGVSRLVVVGTSSFVDNSSLMTGGNRDFFMSALNWLLEREQLIAVGPKTPDEFRLSMSHRQVRGVQALVLGVMPGAVALAGLLIWIRRRK
jgi:ABC-type uncharacterized transport system involved in gliding motility auxiliary subunit